MFQHLVCTNWFEVDCHAQLAVRTPPGLVRWEKATQPNKNSNPNVLHWKQMQLVRLCNCYLLNTCK